MILGQTSASSDEPVAIAPRVAIRVRDVQGLGADGAAALADELADALRTATGRTVSVDSPHWPCEGPQCPYEIRVRTGAGEIVMVDALAAGSRLRLLMERILGDDTSDRRIQIDLARSDQDVKRSLAQLIELLFPRASLPPPMVVATAAAMTGDRSPLVPAVLLGAGTAALVAGVVLRLTSHAARDEAETLVAGPEFESARDRATTHLTLSSVVWIGAAALVSAGATLLLID